MLRKFMGFFKKNGYVKTLRLGNKLYILNGVDPMRYVDLTTNTCYVLHPIKQKEIIPPKKVKIDSRVYYRI